MTNIPIMFHSLKLCLPYMLHTLRTGAFAVSSKFLKLWKSSLWLSMNIEILRRLVCDSCLSELGLGARGFPVCTPGREHLEYFCQWEGCLGLRDSGISPVWNPHEQFHSDCTLSHVTDIHPCKHNVLQNSVAHPGVSPSEGICLDAR